MNSLSACHMAAYYVGKGETFALRSHDFKLTKDALLRKNVLYLVIEGAVMSRRGGRGVHLIGPGEFINPEVSLGCGIQEAVTYHPIKKCVAVRVGLEHYNTEHLLAFAQLVERRRVRSEIALSLAGTDVETRCAYFLLLLYSKSHALGGDGWRTVRVSRLVIASFASCSREMVGRVLKRWEARQTIIVAGHSIQLSPGFIHDHRSLLGEVF